MFLFGSPSEKPTKPILLSPNHTQRIKRPRNTCTFQKDQPDPTHTRGRSENPVFLQKACTVKTSYAPCHCAHTRASPSSSSGVGGGCHRDLFGRCGRHISLKTSPYVGRRLTTPRCEPSGRSRHPVAGREQLRQKPRKRCTDPRRRRSRRTWRRESQMDAPRTAWTDHPMRATRCGNAGARHLGCRSRNQ